MKTLLRRSCFVMREVTLVLVINAAPSAILLPISHSSLMCG